MCLYVLRYNINSNPLENIIKSNPATYNKVGLIPGMQIWFKIFFKKMMEMLAEIIGKVFYIFNNFLFICHIIY